jgi:hypothetical protein
LTNVTPLNPPPSLRALNHLDEISDHKLTIPSQYALGPVARSELEARLKVLDTALEGSDPRIITLRLNRFFELYPQLRNTDHEDAERMVVRYSTILSGLPDWAVRDALEAILDGAVATSHAPTGADIRKLAKDAQAPFITERDNIRKVTRATVIEPPATDEQRERAGDWWESVKREWFPSEGETPEGKLARERNARRQEEANKRLADRERTRLKVPEGVNLHPEVYADLVAMGANFGRVGVGGDADDGRSSGGREA